MMITYVCTAHGYMFAIKRIEMHTIGGGNIQTCAGGSPIRIVMTINTLPGLAAVHCLHDPVPIGDNSHIAIIRRYSHVQHLYELFAKGSASPAITEIAGILCIRNPILT